MTELSEQLRIYIDSVAEPVGLDEVRARAGVAHPVDDVGLEPSARRPRRRSLAVVLAAALVLVMVAVLLVARSNDESTSTVAARPAAHGEALTVLRDEACTDKLAGGTLALGAQLSDGLTVCVVQHPADAALFVNGHSAGTYPGQLSAQPALQLLSQGTNPDHGTVMLNVGADVATVRFTFCDGTIIDTAPFAGPTGARFAGINVNTARYGIPGWQILDTIGKPLAAASPAMKPFTAKTGPIDGCDVKRLSDLAPTWTSTPVTVNNASPQGATALAANDNIVTLATIDNPANVSGSQAVIAAAPSLGALSAVTPDLGQGALDTMVAWPGGFVASGVTSPSAPYPARTPAPQHAEIWASPDGVNWTAADTAPFTAAKHSKSTYDSRVAGIAEHNGLLGAIGDYQTQSPKSRQCCGLSPALWTSRDGLHWQRRLLDLGNEFDPYMESIVWFHGQWVATGRAGRFPLVVWTSKDLAHWDHRVIAQNAGGQATVANGALYLVGGTSSGPKTHRTTTPIMWRSTDAVHWERVLTLPRAPIGSLGAIGFVYSANGVLVSVATVPEASSRGSTNAVYESLDGRHWATMPTPFPAGTDIRVGSLLRGRPTYLGLVGSTMSAWSATR